MTYSVRQSVTGGSPYDSAPTVTLGAIQEGNLLIVSAAERSGATTASISGTGWLPLILHHEAPTDGTYRKTLAAWYKTAGLNEPTSLTVTFNTTGAVSLIATEYDTFAEASSPMQLVEAVSAGYNVLLSSYSPGTLTPFAAPRCLLVGIVMTKTNLDTEVPYSTWINENLLTDATYNGGAQAVDAAIASLDMYDVNPLVELTSTAQKPSGDDADRGGIAMIAAFVPETTTPPAETSLLTESGLVLLTESGQPILI